MCLNNDDRIERVIGLVNFTPEPELNEGLGRKHTHRKKKLMETEIAFDGAFMRD